MNGLESFEGRGIMSAKSRTGVIASFIVLIFLVAAGSYLSAALWGGKPEGVPADKPLTIEPGMTVAGFGEINHLDKAALKKIFGLTSPGQMEQKVEDFGLAPDELAARAAQSQALADEYESKDWFKIPLKFALWFLFLGFVFFLIRRRRVTPRTRKYLYLTSLILFGVVLGSDPSPMGTVKDALVLYGARGVIFPPRLIAMTVFLVTVFLANKFICAWGCQLGALQDFIFRLGRDGKDRKGFLRQYKVPFVVTNTVRVAFFTVFTVTAFTWAVDIIDPVDPFKIFKPAALTAFGAIFAAVIVVASLFIYRPWCHFFCPFGLAGWLVEKISLFKVAVDYDTCIACEACARACPSTVMSAILKREKTVIPDCFNCAVCVDVCPTKSISLTAARRSRPPAGKFDVKRKEEADIH